MTIIFLGAPGSGKSTQARLLAEKLKVPHVQMGEEIRQAAEEPTKQGGELKKLLEKGELIGDGLISSLLKKIIFSQRCRNGFIIDGAPRKLSQADDVERFIKESGLKLTKVFLVNVGDRECITRLLKRKRADDNLQTVKHRLQLYHQETDPVVDHYQQMGILEEVDGERGIEEIFKDIMERLRK